MMEHLIEPPVWLLKRKKDKPSLVGEAISESVQDFAKLHRIQAVVRHHDEPLWYLSQDKGMADDWIRTTFVQIGTFQGFEAPRVRATPGARMVNEKRKIARVMVHPSPSVDVEIGPADDLDSFNEKLQALLQQSWKAALKLEPLETDFVEVSLPS